MTLRSLFSPLPPIVFLLLMGATGGCGSSSDSDERLKQAEERLDKVEGDMENLKKFLLDGDAEDLEEFLGEDG